MSLVTCHLRSDFGVVRLVADGREHIWRAETPNEEEQADAIWWRSQAQRAAAWVVETVGSGGTIDLVCLDADDASCAWVGAPSDDARVVGAVMRQPESAWEDLGAEGAILPLTDPPENENTPLSGALTLSVLQRRAKAAGAGRRFPVLCLPDALARLWLDDLDKQGVRVGVVLALWHAMSLAWDTPPEPPERPEPSDTPSASEAPTASKGRTKAGASGGDRAEGGSSADAPALSPSVAAPVVGVVLVQDRRISWSWSRAGRLLVGGEQRVPNAAPDPNAPVADAFAMSESQGEGVSVPEEPAQDFGAACARLSLEWLTWSAQLGEGPERVIVVGVDASALGELIGRTWPEATVETVVEEDALAATIGRAAALSSRVSDHDPRASFVPMSRRRGRAHQRLYTWAGAAMALLGVGIGAMAWRAHERRNALQSEREAVVSLIRARVSEATGTRADAAFPVRTLESALERVRRERPDFEDPARARPIMKEMTRLARVLADLTPSGLEIDEIVMDERTPNARVFVPDFALGEDLRERLRASPGGVRWDVTFESQEPNRQRWRLVGLWDEVAR
ncbi:MAG: hypothetical protein EA379_06320 [Phycisphaerales bacterium]|nr:MAG: hypothetical protein EA379_06320 [Phycisphaerales bacterium]